MPALLFWLCVGLAAAWQSLAAVVVTKVATAEELKAALDGQRPHVHITEHLDLTKLTPELDRVYPRLFRLSDTPVSLTV
jgi:hypothetical protein